MKLYSVYVVPKDTKFYSGGCAGIFSTKEKAQEVAYKIEQHEETRYCIVGEIEVDKEQEGYWCY